MLPTLRVLVPTLFVTLFACKADVPATETNDASDVVRATDSTNAGGSGASESEFTIWNTDANPESLTIDGIRVYVTHFGPKLEPSTQDGDGYIATYDADGTRTGVLVEGLDAPKGSELIGNVLYVADVDTLFGFNTTTGEREFAMSFTGQSEYLNGLTRGKPGELYLSATDAGKVWRVDLSRGGSAEVIAQIPGANGLTYDEFRNLLYVVNFIGDDPTAGRVRAVDLATGNVSTVVDYAGMLDGAALVGNNLYFTDWSPGDGEGKMLHLNLGNEVVTEVASDSLFAGPADFDVLGDGLALVPMLTGGRVVAMRLPSN